MKSLLAPPTPRMTSLPAAFFFVRVLEVEAGADASAVAQQVELAIEAWAPFPLNQIYFGYAWRTGAKRAVVYAAYRRRFPAELQELWPLEEWVAPSFAPWLLREAKRAETLLFSGVEGLTVLHWGEPGPVPSQIVTRPFPPDATDEQKAALRADLLRDLGGSIHIEEVAAEFTAEGGAGAAEWTFFAGEGAPIATVSRAELEAMDVRDRGDLEARRRAARREHLLWRTFLISLWVLLVGLVVQAGLAGATLWERSREERLARRAPEIEAINRSNELATRIEELATRRLHPFEMIDVAKEKKPPTVVYRSLTTVGLNQLEINGTTSVAADLPAYREVLLANPFIERAEFTDQSARDGVTTFRLQVTFKPDAFHGGPNS